jgi:hypothetical protein
MLPVVTLFVFYIIIRPELIVLTAGQSTLLTVLRTIFFVFSLQFSTSQTEVLTLLK